MYKYITTICGNKVMVDKDIYDKYSKYSWRIPYEGSVTSSHTIDGKREVSLRKLVLNTKNQLVYYRDGDFLNHTLDNLTLTNVVIESFEDYCEGTLPNGKVFIFDSVYRDLIESRPWTMSTNGYIMCSIKGKREYLHRLIMKPAHNYVVDHINGNKSDNRISNLRVCTHRDNIANSQKQLNGEGYTSNYKGVSKSKSGNFTVRVARERYGTYIDEDVAANVYNHYAKKIYGEYARINEVAYMPILECFKFKL